MEVIPVIDLMGGAVVHARLGERGNYRPIKTPLSPSSDPVDVVRGLLTIHPFKTFYVADLDGIQGRGSNRTSLMRLRADFPHLMWWVDSGIADLRRAQNWLDEGLGALVLGSESLADVALTRHFSGNPRVALSLDFRGSVFQGPPALLAETAAWPRRVIAMTLSRVGSGAGPDLERLAAIRKAASGKNIYAAGGVRDVRDLITLKQAGIDGALVASSLHDGRLTGSDIIML